MENGENRRTTRAASKNVRADDGGVRADWVFGQILGRLVRESSWQFSSMIPYPPPLPDLSSLSPCFSSIICLPFQLANPLLPICKDKGTKTNSPLSSPFCHDKMVMAALIANGDS
jgi:hypothetical protein